MNTYPIPALGLAQRWSPPAYSPRMSQAAPAPAPAPTQVTVQPEKPSLLDIDAPLIQFLTSAVAATSTAILGYHFGAARSRWSTVFWIASGITSFKALVDLSRLK